MTACGTAVRRPHVLGLQGLGGSGFRVYLGRQKPTYRFMGSTLQLKVPVGFGVAGRFKGLGFRIHARW